MSLLKQLLADLNRSGLSYGIGAFVVTFVLLFAFPQWWEPLLAVNGYIPHGHCYLWQPGLVWLHLTSDLLIALAYVAISATLAYLVYRTRRDIPFHWMFLAFGAFIVACGSTHLMAVWTLWYPTYWLSGALKVVTAVASITTAAILPFLVPQAMALVESAKLSEERRLNLEAANHTFAALNAQLKESDQLKTQFFANVSHELRTPLALILGPIDKLLSQAELPQTHREDLTIVNRNARLLLKQVNDLLDVSRLEAGRMELDCKSVDLAQLVRLTAANFDGIAQDKAITFTVDAPDTLIAQLDGGKVQRILLNLLSNAFKFTPEGGTIYCGLVPKPAGEGDAFAEQIDGSDLDSGSVERALLVLRDSGPGIPAEQRQLVFERFRQGEGDATRRFGGTGLGLAIAKEFVELQGGSIDLGEADEGGAQFTIELPLSAPNSISPSPPRQEQTEDMIDLAIEELRTPVQFNQPIQADVDTDGKPLVLVVEDNPEMNRFITDSLVSAYRTASAMNGQEGLAQALVLRPDLIVSDVMMPYLSGDQLVEQLRTFPELEATPVVMLTAKTEQKLRVELLRQGAQDYLTKPFSMAELRARVDNLVTMKRVRELLQQELASQSHDLETLAEEISQRRRELQTALETVQRQTRDLEQANRLKDEFLAIVSHELRTPLNSILGWAKILRTRHFDETVTARALETIERNARLQTRLVQDLLDFSKALRNQLSIKHQSMDLATVITAALQTVQPAAETKAIHLEISIANEVALISGDDERLQQVVENLLTNAIKFTPAGGQVEVRLENDDTTAIIQIQDTGEGISPDALPYIFDYFWQADSSNRREHGGLGLGLAIVRQLIELHGGNIQVESPGRGLGTKFMIFLPLLVHSSEQSDYLY